MTRCRRAGSWLLLAFLGPVASLHGQLLIDGGFEAGPGGSAWSEFSQNFATPICDTATCGISSGTGAAAGDWWAWFGGSDTAEEAFVEQSFTLTPGNVYHLRFDLEHPTSSGNGEDFLRVLVDGVEIFRFNEGESGHAAYKALTLDLSPFADGASHTLRFHSQVTGSGGISSFFLTE